MQKAQKSKFSVRGTSGTTSAKEYRVNIGPSNSYIYNTIFFSASSATCAPTLKFGILLLGHVHLTLTLETHAYTCETDHGTIFIIDHFTLDDRPPIINIIFFVELKGYLWRSKVNLVSEP